MGSTDSPEDLDLNKLYENASKWTLAQDASLFGCLEEVSKKITDRATASNKLLQSTWEDCQHSSIRLQACVNSFNMLSNVQFMESRVREEDYKLPKKTEIDGAQDAGATSETPEIKRVRELREAITLTQAVLQQDFDVVEINLEDSDDEETSPSKRTFREPKDPYLRRPLPYLIGSIDFHRDRFIGLRLPTDEPQVTPDEDLILTAKLDDILVAPSSGLPRTPTQKSSTSTLSDISEDRGNNSRTSLDPAPARAVSSAATPRVAPPVIGSSDSEDENDLFATRPIISSKPKPAPSPTPDPFQVTPPPLIRTSSQTSSRSSTVPSGSTKPTSSLFDDDDEDGDLFSTKKLRSGTLKPAPVPAPAEPAKPAKPVVASRMKPPAKVSSLFDDDAEDDDDLFAAPKSKPVTPANKSLASSTSSLSEAAVMKSSPQLPSSSSGPLISELAKKIGPAVSGSGAKPEVKERQVAAPVLPAESVKAVMKKPTLFDDDSDEDDLFALPKKPATKVEPKNAVVSPVLPPVQEKLAEPEPKRSNEVSHPKSTVPAQKSPLDATLDQPSVISKPPVPVAAAAVPNGLPKAKPASAIFEDDSDDQDDLFSVKPKPPAAAPSIQSKPVAAPAPVASKPSLFTDNKPAISVTKKKATASIFDDEDSDDLFAVKKPPPPAAAAVPAVVAVKAELPVQKVDSPLIKTAVAETTTVIPEKSPEELKIPSLGTPVPAVPVEETSADKVKKPAKETKKNLLFDSDDDEEDLFAVKKVPNKGPVLPSSVPVKTPVASASGGFDPPDSRQTAVKSPLVLAESLDVDTVSPTIMPLVAEKQDISISPLGDRPEEQFGSGGFGEPQLEPPSKTAPPRMLHGGLQWKLPGLTGKTDEIKPESPTEDIVAETKPAEIKPAVKPSPPAPRARRSAPPQSPVIQPEVIQEPIAEPPKPPPRSIPSSRSGSFSLANKPATIFEDREDVSPVKLDFQEETVEAAQPPPDTAEKSEPVKRKAPVPARRNPAVVAATVSPSRPDVSALEISAKEPAPDPVVDGRVRTNPVSANDFETHARSSSPTDSFISSVTLSLEAKNTQNLTDSVEISPREECSDLTPQQEMSRAPEKPTPPTTPVLSRPKSISSLPNLPIKAPSPDLNDEFNEPDTAKKLPSPKPMETPLAATVTITQAPVELSVMDSEAKVEPELRNAAPIDGVEKSPPDNEASSSPSKSAPLVVRIPVFSLPDTEQPLSQVPEPPPLSFSSISSSQSSLKKRGESLFDDDDSDEELFGGAKKHVPTSKVPPKTIPVAKPSPEKPPDVSKNGFFDLRQSPAERDPLRPDTDSDVTPDTEKPRSGSSVFDVKAPAKKATTVFESDDDDIFGGPPPLPTTVKTEKSTGLAAGSKKKQPALFDEDSDSDDLFRS